MIQFTYTGKGETHEKFFSYRKNFIQLWSDSSFWGLVMLNVNLFEHTSETVKYIILITE